MKALFAYYLGVFALIPCLGALLALGAIPLGVMGLQHAKRHPESHGTAHAWVGIILGGLVLAGHAVLLLLPYLTRR
jgi:hypothetical protein